MPALLSSGLRHVSPASMRRGTNSRTQPQLCRMAGKPCSRRVSYIRFCAENSHSRNTAGEKKVPLRYPMSLAMKAPSNTNPRAIISWKPRSTRSISVSIMSRTQPRSCAMATSIVSAPMMR